MSRGKVHPDVYPMSERDWPVLLHAQVSIRRSVGVKAFLTFADTLPPNRPEDRLRASLTADSRDRSPLTCLGYLETMLAQLHRQYELLQSRRG